MYEYYDYDDKSQQAKQEEAARRYQAQKRAEKKNKRKKFWGVVALALVFGLISGGAFIGINTLNDYLSNGKVEFKIGKIKDAEEPTKKAEFNESKDSKDSDKAEDKTSDNSESTAEVNKAPVSINKSEGVTTELVAASGEVGASVKDVAKTAMPSIVAITNKSLQEVRMFFTYETQIFESESEGSGIIVGQNDKELLILTNNHVVEHAETLTVSFIDEEAYEAKVKGADPALDIAVIAVKLDDLKQGTKDEIEIALIGDSDKLEIGDQVVAIGNALGYGQSVTTGIVSALERQIGRTEIEGGFIQTDAAINPGNSGGALLNMKGEVIGINSAKLSNTQVEGMCYAIPISTAVPTAETLMNRETREIADEDEAGYIGIAGVIISKADSEKYQMPEGVYLQQITKDSAAERAGLQVGDILEKFDGLTISSYSDFLETMKYYRAGEEVEITYYRQNDGKYEERTATLTLGKRPKVDE